MSAFGRRGGGPGQRPSFGVARPMKGGPGGAAPVPAPEDGGEQFPPLESLPISDDGAPLEPAPGDAMSRLADRMALSGDSAPSKNEGFEASIHRIKEQVLPRLLERVDPEAAATLSKDELAEEFRSEEHTSELQSLMRISYAVYCWKKKNQ